MKLWKHIAIILFLLKVSATGVLAHSKMVESMPPHGSTSTDSLETIQLSFKKPVRVMLVKVRRTDQAADISLMSKDKSAFSKTYKVIVPPLTAGVYSVNWTAVSKDGHVRKGVLTFTIEH